jgi:hypothetical protein
MRSGAGIPGFLVFSGAYRSPADDIELFNRQASLYIVDLRL